MGGACGMLDHQNCWNLGPGEGCREVAEEEMGLGLVSYWHWTPTAAF